MLRSVIITFIRTIHCEMTNDKMRWHFWKLVPEIRFYIALQTHNLN